MAATTSNETSSTFVLGADGVAPVRGGAVKPVGSVHVVDGWQPLCGADRVRFVFPGRGPDQIDGDGCAACVAAVTTASRGARSRRAS